MTSKIRMPLHMVLAALLVLGATGALVSMARADDVDQEALNRAHAFLKTADRGRFVLNYVHSGTKYRSYSFQESRFVTDGNGKRIAGHFALVYNLKWADDGETQVGFLCDATGNVYKVQIVRTNAEFSQPFAVANLTIKVLGNLIVKAFENQMTAAQKQEVQKAVDDADAKTLLESALKLQQVFGR